MDYLLQLFHGSLNNPGHANLAFAAVVGLNLALATLAVGLIVIALVDPMHKRLRMIRNNQGSLHSEIGGPVEHAGLMAQIGAGLRLGARRRDTPRVDTKLLRAGYESSTAHLAFYGIRFLLAIVLPASVLLAVTLFPWFSVQQVALAVPVAAAIGFIAPGLVLDYKKRQRQQEMLEGVADALDLLVACTEAGMGLNSALDRVADELEVSYPALAHQFHLVNYEIRGGVDRLTALRNLYARTGLETIRGLVGILAQTLRYGTSVAQTLRVYADDLRDRRMQAAEEQAAKIGTKMIFPLVLCLLPSFFIVAIGPAVIGVLRAFNFQ